MGRIQIVILTGLLLCMGGCSEHRVRKELESFLSQEVKFPSTLIGCPGESTGSVTLLSDSFPKLIIYVDSTQCSSCRVGHLSDYLPLYEKSVQGRQYTLAVIISPPVADYGYIMHLLETYKYPFPVFIDKNHSFRKENSFIPDDTRFHAFLLDRLHRPVMVGDPARSEKIRRLFEQVLTEL